MIILSLILKQRNFSFWMYWKYWVWLVPKIFFQIEQKVYKLIENYMEKFVRPRLLKLCIAKVWCFTYFIEFFKYLLDIINYYNLINFVWKICSVMNASYQNHSKKDMKHSSCDMTSMTSELWRGSHWPCRLPFLLYRNHYKLVYISLTCHTQQNITLTKCQTN
jgi:hypothetical protein